MNAETRMNYNKAASACADAGLVMMEEDYERDIDHINSFNFVRSADPVGIPRKDQQQAAVCTLVSGSASADDTGFGRV